LSRFPGADRDTLHLLPINLVDLMALQPPGEHPHGLDDKDFDVLFTKDKPIIFAYQGYPSIIHRLTYGRTNHANLHVRGDKEEGATTTFNMAVHNDIDRFHLVKDVVDRVPRLGSHTADLTQLIRDKLIDHKRYIERYGDDMPEIGDWRWGAPRAADSTTK
jgi:xylulose-5-phosphate/fructose-6-phosphate phosphoketolase